MFLIIISVEIFVCSVSPSVLLDFLTKGIEISYSLVFLCYWLDDRKGKTSYIGLELEGRLTELLSYVVFV